MAGTHGSITIGPFAGAVPALGLWATVLAVACLIGFGLYGLRRRPAVSAGLLLAAAGVAATMANANAVPSIIEVTAPDCSMVKTYPNDGDATLVKNSCSTPVSILAIDAICPGGGDVTPGDCGVGHTLSPGAECTLHSCSTPCPLSRSEHCEQCANRCDLKQGATCPFLDSPGCGGVFDDCEYNCADCCDVGC